MDGMGLKLTPVVVRYFLGPLACLNLWMATLGLIASPNSPDRKFNLPPAAHPLPLPTPPLLPTHPLPLICATCDSTMVVKQLIKIQQC